MDWKIHVVKYGQECIHKPERHYFGKHSTPLLLVQSYIIILSSNNSQCSIYQGKNPTKAQVLPAPYTAVQLQLTSANQSRVVCFLQLINIFLSHKRPVYMYHPTLPVWTSSFFMPTWTSPRRKQVYYWTERHVKSPCDSGKPNVAQKSPWGSERKRFNSFQRNDILAWCFCEIFLEGKKISITLQEM